MFTAKALTRTLSLNIQITDKQVEAIIVDAAISQLLNECTDRPRPLQLLIIGDILLIGLNRTTIYVVRLAIVLIIDIRSNFQLTS